MGIDAGAYIADLLYEHDSVAIPGLGGFVARYKPAFADQVQGELHPPAKGLQFNTNLVMDDGLLAEYIRDKHHISLAEAKKEVERYVQGVLEAINRREIVVLPKVGRLYKDYEQNLQFLSDGANFNTDSYGLPVIHFYPLARPERPAAVKAEGAPAPPAPQPKAGLQALLSRIFGNGLAVIIGFGGIVALLSVYFLFFYERPAAETQAPPSSRINISPSMELPADTAGEDDDLLIGDSYIGEEPAASPEEPDTEAPTIAPGQRYVLISLGVFGNEDNAQRLVQRVYDAGYEPYTEKMGNRTRVGIQKAYSSDAEIRAILDDIREKGLAKDAKVLKR